jgi:plasmid stabilization system protein ParE
MAEIRWTEESVQWLQDIYEYISADNLKAAEKVISTIYEKAQVLRDHPGIGHKYQTVSGREVRILLYGHYRITYLIKKSGDIDILGIFHGALDIDRYLI